MSVKPSDGDGMLGQRWFAGGIWTFDYPAHKLILHADAALAGLATHSVIGQA